MRQKFDRVEYGMTRDDVASILGTPTFPQSGDAMQPDGQVALIWVSDEGLVGVTFDRPDWRVIEKHISEVTAVDWRDRIQILLKKLGL
jgi:hypothetical protein